ncbi:MAG TPA: ComEC/Rec2 family competence protein, partial [Hyphomicrobiaceae bacterium]
CNLIVMPAALASLLAMPFGLEAAPLKVMGLGIEAIVWCAQRVAGLPGAVGRVPAIPTHAFLLMVAGGLWLALMRTRWRLLGLAPIVLGLTLAPTGRRPDVLIGRAASVVAVRAADGRLSALAGRGSSFELARWLEHDGDARPPAEVARAAAFRCDPHGCTARVGGMLLAVAYSPAALRDDCAAAAILVLRFPQPTSCNARGPVIDSAAIDRSGALALYLDGGRVARIETVADRRGDRPWAARRSDDPDDQSAPGPADEEWPAVDRRSR